MCPSLNISSVTDNADFVTPVLSPEADVPFGENVTFECTVPGRDPEVTTGSQQCVYDATVKQYRLVGDSIECPSEWIVSSSVATYRAVMIHSDIFPWSGQSSLIPVCGYSAQFRSTN